MSKTTCILVLMLHILPSLGLFAQGFGRASVRRSAFGTRGSHSETTNEVAYRGIGLRALIMKAYGVRANQIVGPAEMDSEIYDVVATLPPGTDPGATGVPLMLKSLLEERFALRVRMETVDSRVQALFATKDGFRAPAFGGSELRDGIRIDPQPLGTLLTASTLEGLARGLSMVLRTMVVDKTNIAGRYRLDVLLASPEVNGSVRHPGPISLSQSNFEPSASLQDSLRKLGLTLATQQGPVTTLIVEQVNALPAVEN